MLHVVNVLLNDVSIIVFCDLIQLIVSSAFPPWLFRAGSGSVDRSLDRLVDRSVDQSVGWVVEANPQRIRNLLD